MFWWIQLEEKDESSGVTIYKMKTSFRVVVEGLSVPPCVVVSPCVGAWVAGGRCLAGDAGGVEKKKRIFFFFF
jgi:hypothetical protein